MPEILLIRHGPPACDRRTRIRGSDFGRWVADYDLADLDPQCPPPAHLAKRLADVTAVVTSTLRRSLASAALLCPGRDVLSDPLFDEVGIPTRIPLALEMSPELWDRAVRAAWLLWWSPDTKSLRAASSRAR